jgi:5-methylcytosine-specific restriction endonuclease McrA
VRPSRALRGGRWRGLDRTWFKRELARRHGLKCAACGQRKTRKALVMDHIIPWSKGGPTTLENLQLLCGPCDVAKGAS